MVDRKGSPYVWLGLGAAGLLLSLLVPGLLLAGHYGRVKTATIESALLTRAVLHYFNEYGSLPIARLAQAHDVRLGRELSNAGVFFALRAMEGTGNEAHVLNPRRIIFLPQAFLWAQDRRGSGELLDPWGSPYQIVLDTDLNDRCDLPDSAIRNQVPGNAIAWSSGPDRVPDSTDDVGLFP